MSVQDLSEYTRIAKYARYLPEKRRRETWTEQIDRVFDMHRKKYDQFLEQDNELSLAIGKAYSAVVNKEILGSQRVLQFGGDPIFKHNARLYNCVTSYANRPRFFQEYMYMLLCGCGVGFSVQRHHVAQFPKIGKPVDHRDPFQEKFTVPDTIEGWAAAVGILINSYFYQGQYTRDAYSYVEFDFSLIRPAGAKLSSGAKAPGPEGLKRALAQIRQVLDEACSEGDTLRPIHVYDICMHAADAVISGGVRRSATISLFSPDDEEMANAKTGDWFIKNPQRGRSNNSGLLIRANTTLDDFTRLMQAVKQFGEPGFLFSDSTEMLVNPCVEIGMYAAIEYNDVLYSGWQCCNLCEINGRKAKTPEQFWDACIAAAVMGTLQAGYTDFPYLRDPEMPINASEEIVRKEALLGVSITGMMDSPDVLFNPVVLRHGAELVKETNRRIAKLIGINPAARTTCIKPAGGSSAVLGTASGIHPHHSRRYLRRVQANYLENPVRFYESINPRAVETSVWDPNGFTKVIAFQCEVPKGARTKNQLNAVQLLSHVRLVQEHWVATGKNEELCSQPWLTHNVSNTINVMPEEWDEVTQYIYENRHAFAGVSLLPSSGDKDYPQAPFTNVLTATEIVREYGEASMFASGLIEQAVRAFNNNLWAAADCLLGVGIPWNARTPGQIEWCNDATKYANRFFAEDLRQMTYCLKDVYNLNLWEKLSIETKPVDWTEMLEDEDNVNAEAELACAGGNCEMPAWMLEEIYGEKKETES